MLAAKSCNNKRMRQEGFTLIEILVVILIIAILIAIAVPEFLGQKEKAQDAGAKGILTNVYKNARADAVLRDDKFVDASCDVVCLAEFLNKAEPQYGPIISVATLDNIEPSRVYVLSGLTNQDRIKLAYKTGDRVWTLSAVETHQASFALNESLDAYSNQVLADNPLLYHRLQETTPGVVADYSGKSNNGLYGPSPVLGQLGPLSVPSTSISNRFETAPMSFTDGSIEFWIKRNSDSTGLNFVHLVDPGAAVNANQINISYATGGELNWYASRDTTSQRNYISNVSDGGWHHVVWTRDTTDDVIKTFVDGQETSSDQTLDNSKYQFRYGAPTSGFSTVEMPAPGQIAEFAVYQKALTAQQVAAHFAAR